LLGETIINKIYFATHYINNAYVRENAENYSLIKNLYLFSNFLYNKENQLIIPTSFQNMFYEEEQLSKRFNYPNCDNEFPVPLGNDYNAFPGSSFPVCKPATNILNQQPGPVYRGILVKKLEAIREKINDLNSDINEGTFYFLLNKGMQKSVFRMIIVKLAVVSGIQNFQTIHMEEPRIEPNKETIRQILRALSILIQHSDTNVRQNQYLLVFLSIFL